MAERTRLTRFEWACSALILTALASRLLVLRFRHPNWDAAWYLTMGKSLVEHGEFVSPWISNTTYTQHFPPAYPALDAVAYAIAGPSFVAAGIVSVLVALFLAAVVFFTTRDLYGQARAFAVTAIVATSATLADFDLQLLSESLVVAFFALTIWAILKSLDAPKYILFAGFFAGLGYLTKASMGPFFLLAGAGGFAWRFYYARWSVFRDIHYMGAAGIFALFVFPWAWRNVRTHGWPHWETQPHASDAIAHFFSLSNWPLVLALEFFWGGAILAAFALPFLPEIRASFRRIREERTSALWLGVVTPTVIGLIFAAAFAKFESRPIVAESTIRYLVTPLVPLLWLGLREMDLSSPGAKGSPRTGGDLVRSRSAWLVGGVTLVAFVHFANPTHPFLSTARLWIFFLFAAAGVAMLLLARSSTWTAVNVKDAGWRAVRAPLFGAPSGWLALFAFAFALAITLGVAVGFATLLIPAAASLAAGSPRARVLVLTVCTVMAPLSLFQAPSNLAQASEDLNALAGPSEIVATETGVEQYVYPFLRSDIGMATPDRPYDWWLAFGDYGISEEAPPGATLVREYQIHHVPGPGAAFGIWFWGLILEDVPDTGDFVQARLYRMP